MNKRRLPNKLHYGNGLSILLEDLVSRAALLRSLTEKYYNEASALKVREPISYPEAQGLFELASTIYHALAQNVYRKESGNNDNFI